MHCFRVVYHQGSFALSRDCQTQEEAIARAVSLKRSDGVWHVHIEDGSGRPVLRSHDLSAWRDTSA